MSLISSLIINPKVNPLTETSRTQRHYQQQRKDGNSHGKSVLEIIQTLAADFGQTQDSGPFSLEGMPPELEVMILCRMPDRKSLSAIVRASPNYHNAYLGAREEVLHSVAIQVLRNDGVGLLDPLAAIRASQLDRNVEGRKKNVTEFLERYGNGEFHASQRFSVDESLALLDARKKIAALVPSYFEATIAHKSLSKFRSTSSSPFSVYELRRLYRAFWRFEIYSNLFERREQSASLTGTVHESEDFEAEEIVTGFLFLFPPWEVEQLTCISDYVQEIYEDMFSKYKTDILQKLPLSAHARK